MNASSTTEDESQSSGQPSFSSTSASTRTDTLDQLDTLLTYIRTNLSNIRQTWGVESQQYVSAVEIMQAYLTENVERLKGRGMLGPGQAGSTNGAAEQREQVATIRTEREGQIERSIEELMRDLALSM